MTGATRSRRAIVLPTLAMVAGTLFGWPADAGAQRSTSARYEPLGDGRYSYQVPVAGGGQVEVPLTVPAHVDPGTVRVTGRRTATVAPQQPVSTTHGPAASTGPSVVAQSSAGAGQGAEARRDKVAPGTVVGFAGGYCDGFDARRTTISPAQLAYTASGELWWLDDEFSGGDLGFDGWDAGDGYGRRNRGSWLIRRIDSANRVRTVTTVLLPSEGRAARHDLSFLTMVPDPSGGVLVQHNGPAAGDQDGVGQYKDVPAFTSIVHIRPDGSHRAVVGGRPLTDNDRRIRASTYGDGERLLDTVLGYVTAFTADTRGNLYIADAVNAGAASQGLLGQVRIRFANRGRTPVTFYRGTAMERTVAAGRIGTIAGPGDWLLSLAAGRGNGLPVETAAFQTPSSLAVHDDVLYIADPYNADPQTPTNLQIRAINLGTGEAQPKIVAGTPIPVGVIDAVAGDGQFVAGYAGDGGQARQAKFNVRLVGGPRGYFAVDRSGNIFVADVFNNRIRRIDALTGVIMTVAGTGAAAPVGPGTAALATPVWNPYSVAVDKNGDIAYADYFNKVVRRLSTNLPGDLPIYDVGTIAGIGAVPCGNGTPAMGTSIGSGAYFGDVVDVATDSKGNTYVADLAAKNIRRVNSRGIVDLQIGLPQECRSWLRFNTRRQYCPSVGNRSGDGGALTAAQFAGPNYVAVDAYDNLVVSDVDRVRYVNVGSRAVTVGGVAIQPGTVETLHTFANRTVLIDTAGLPLPAPPATPVIAPIGGVAVSDRGEVFVADQMLGVVYRLSACGDLTIVAGDGRPGFEDTGDGGPALEAAIQPYDLVWVRNRNMLVMLSNKSGSSQQRSRIRAVNFADRSQYLLGRTIAPGSIDTIAGAGPCGHLCSYGDGGPAREATFAGQSSLAFGRDGTLYFIDIQYNRVRAVLPDGTMAGLSSPWPEVRNCLPCPWYQIAPSGYLGDGGRALDAWFSFRHGLPEATPADFKLWHAVLEVDRHGDLIVNDWGSGRLRKIVQPDRAPLRLTSGVPGIGSAGAGFTTTVLLRDGDRVGPDGTTGPDIARVDGGFVVAAGKGRGRGCRTWELSISANGQTTGAPNSPSGALGRSGGETCHLARGVASADGDGAQLVTAVRTADVEEADGAREAAIEVHTRNDAAGWVSSGAVVPGRTGSGYLGAPAAAKLADGTYWLIALADGGRLTVMTSPNGVAYAPVVAPSPPALDVLGAVVPGADGTVHVFGLRGRAEHATVLHLKSRDGITWTESAIGRRAYASASRPQAAADNAGNLYATWSDAAGAVWFSAARGARSWTPPRRVVEHAAVLPGIVATGTGRVALGYYVAPAARTTSIDDAYAMWYVGSAVSTDALGRQRFAAKVVTPTPVHVGPLCGRYRCTAQRTVSTEVNGTVRDATNGPPAAEGYGPVRVALDDDGRPVLAFVISPRLAGNDSEATVVGVARGCAQRLGTGAPRVTCEPRRDNQALRPGAPPGSGVPVPAVPGLRPCSAVPPPFAGFVARPRPTAADPPRRPVERPRVPAAERPLAPIALPPALPHVPEQPALPPSVSAQVAHQASGQHVVQVQHQPGGQIGVAPADEAEVRRAQNFAASRRDSAPAAMQWQFALLWLFALSGAGVLGAEMRRRKRQPGVALVGSGIRRPCRW